MTNLQRRKDIGKIGDEMPTKQTATILPKTLVFFFPCFWACHSYLKKGENMFQNERRKATYTRRIALKKRSKKTKHSFSLAFWSKIPRVNSRTGGGEHFFPSPTPTFLKPFLGGASFGRQVHSSENIQENLWFRHF